MNYVQNQVRPRSSGEYYYQWYPGALSPAGLNPSMHAYGGAASYSFKNLYYWYGSASENPPQF